MINLTKERGEIVLEDRALVLERLENFTSTLAKRNTRLGSFVLINALISQYPIETGTISEIVQAGRTGQIHPSLMGPSDLLEQFKVTKLWLPSGTDLPIELDSGDPYELFKLSELAVYYDNGRLIFRISIPLVY